MTFKQSTMTTMTVEPSGHATATPIAMQNKHVEYHRNLKGVRTSPSRRRPFRKRKASADFSFPTLSIDDSDSSYSVSQLLPQHHGLTGSSSTKAAAAAVGTRSILTLPSPASRQNMMMGNNNNNNNYHQQYEPYQQQQQQQQQYVSQQQQQQEYYNGNNNDNSMPAPPPAPPPTFDEVVAAPPEELETQGLSFGSIAMTDAEMQRLQQATAAGTHNKTMGRHHALSRDYTAAAPMNALEPTGISIGDVSMMSAATNLTNLQMKLDEGETSFGTMMSFTTNSGYNNNNADMVDGGLMDAVGTSQEMEGSISTFARTVFLILSRRQQLMQQV